MYKSIYEVRLNNFLFLLEHHFGGKKIDFAQALELENASFLSRITTTKNPKNIGDALARKMEEITGKPPFWMDLPHPENDKQPEPVLMLENKYAIIHSLSIRACCGSGALVDFEEVSDGYAFKREWIERKGYQVNNLEVIRAAGDSMFPLIRDGDILLVDKNQTALSPTRSATYVISYAGEASIKIIQYAPETNEVTLVSANPDKIKYPDRKIYLTEDNQENETFRIVGRIVWHGGEM